MPSILDKLSVEIDLHKLVSGHAAFSDFHVEEVLKTGPDQATAICIFGGQKVVIKKFLDAEPARRILAAKAELDTLAAFMNAPPFRVNECLRAFPELGLIVLTFAPGTRLSEAIKHAEFQERMALMNLSGRWLKTYTTGRSEISHKFSPDWWIKKRITAFGENPPKSLVEIFDPVLQQVQNLAAPLRGMSITKAAIHGDYSSINAHYHDGTIYGVDIQGKARLPIVQDVAKFLVWTQLHTPLQHTGDIDFVNGIAEPDVSAFLASDVLPENEIDTLLPFFIGLQILGSMPPLRKGDIALKRAQKLAATYIETS
jgi:hypothetical protein